MALQIRRGLQANLPASPADGELLYATDTNKLYVGDGGTAQEISGGTGSGLANVVEDTTPQLGGSLDVNGFSIISSANGDINIDPNGTGDIILHGSLRINEAGNISKAGEINISPTLLTVGRNDILADGNIYITRNSYSSLISQGITFAQHHETVDAVNFNFYRTRGTGSAPTAVQTGDDLGEITFAGHDGTQRINSSTINFKVGGLVSTGIIPGEISFAVRNIAGSFAEQAKLNSEGIWQVNNIQNRTGTELILTAPTTKIIGDLQLNAQCELKFADSDSSNWVAFQAPSTVSTNVTWTLPAIDGNAGQVLTTNGAGTLSWTPNAGGSGLSSRSVLTPVTTASLPSGASENLIITGYKGYILYKIETSEAAWVRLYSSTVARDNDAGRLEGTDPLPGSGVIAEIISTGAQTILITPGVLGFSSDVSPNTQIPCTITNKTGSTTTITVTLTVLQLEI